MISKTELSFVTDVLAKSRIGVNLVSASSNFSSITDAASPFVGGRFETVGEYLGAISERTVYKRRESCGIEFMYMLIPGFGTESILVIGPYTTERYTGQRVLEEAEKLGIPMMLQRAFGDYLLSMPYVAEEGSVFALVDVLAQRAFGTGYSVEQSDGDDIIRVNYKDVTIDAEADSHAVLAGIRMMEERYSFENELMRLVSEGQSAKAEILLSSISGENFESRVKDSLRNIKNYAIVTNTLLRKAAERGGVHPVNIDKISSRFAVAIESAMSKNECMLLLKDMFKSYCRLVSKNSLSHVSPIVQKTVLLIDNDLSRDLSLSALAEMLSVSPGYLSAIFKRDMKKTVTEYVSDKRVSYAVYLLTTTHLQVQTVASHCGILDVQYFSKIFKKKMGLTPREYREKYKKVN
jgi:AraC-like DNA-binding protein